MYHFLRTHQHIKLKNIEQFKRKLLQWANTFQEVVWLDYNDYHQTYSNFDAILAVDAFSRLQTGVYQGFDALGRYTKATSDWLFGYLSYDLKNDLEDLESSNFDGLNFPDIVFFQPKKIFMFHGDEVSIHYLNEFSSAI